MADTNLPVLLDAGKLGEKIKVRVKELFLDVIPPDVWDGFITREIDAFFNTAVRTFLSEAKRAKPENTSWGYDRDTFEAAHVEATQFRVCVFQALLPLVQKRIADTLADPKFETHVQHALGNLPAAERTGAFLADALKQMVPLMVQGMFEGIFVAAAERVKESLRSAGVQVH